MPQNRPKSPRRKPKQARAQQTIEVVLEGAARVLARRGYAAATTNRIAAEAGVSVGTVYEYFAGKDAVFEALIQREIGALVRAFQAQGFGGDTRVADAAGPADGARRAGAAAGADGARLEDEVRGLIAAGMQAMRHGPELYRVLETVPGAAFRRHLAGAREIVVDLVRQLLERHRDEVRVADLGLAAFVVVSAVEGVGTNADAGVFDERLARELVSLVVSYLTGPPPKRRTAPERPRW
jgi:AcrR family transcriptional regulator